VALVTLVFNVFAYPYYIIISQVHDSEKYLLGIINNNPLMFFIMLLYFVYNSICNIFLGTVNTSFVNVIVDLIGDVSLPHL